MAKKKRNKGKNKNAAAKKEKENPEVVVEEEEATPQKETPPAKEEAPPAQRESDEDSDWDIESGGARPHYLFKVSGFVLIAFGIVIAFGGWYISRRLPLLPNQQILQAHNDIVLRSLLYGVLLILSGVLLKLYALVLVLNRTEEERGLPALDGEWFLKMSTLVFTLTAGAVLIRGYLETHMLEFALSAERNIMSWYIGLYLKKCVISGIFFLVLAIFTMLYLVSLKVVRGTPFEETE